MSRINPFKGISCPVCGSIDIAVMDTRRADGSIYRHRHCDRDHKFWTNELICNEPPAELVKIWNHPPGKRERSASAAALTKIWKVSAAEPN